MQAEHPIIIGGENLIDSIEDTGGATADGFFHNLGGSPYNVAVALGRQGVMTQYVTPISTDDFGGRLAAHLAAQGVSVTGPRLEAPTTRAIVTLKDGIPQYRFLREGTAERMITAQMLHKAIPATARTMVVLPLPLGPSRAQTSPRGKRAETSVRRTGAFSPLSASTREKSSDCAVADIASTFMDDSQEAMASSKNARPVSVGKLRSWTSSKMTSAVPAKVGSCCSRRVSTPSVRTSIRVIAPMRRSSRV
jgi:sugar/nucleoside kinase (ribokinase family)